mmetsp:Transcript_5283/g.13311  ORF Transcript_5283/g.13311 Transcript_5283/m.13311 type:complete len:341 (-) Transcript_5283:246-1268(-)
MDRRSRTKLNARLQLQLRCSPSNAFRSIDRVRLGSRFPMSSRFKRGITATDDTAMPSHPSRKGLGASPSFLFAGTVDLPGCGLSALLFCATLLLLVPKVLAEVQEASGASAGVVEVRGVVNVRGGVGHQIFVDREAHLEFVVGIGQRPRVAGLKQVGGLVDAARPMPDRIILTPVERGGSLVDRAVRDGGFLGLGVATDRLATGIPLIQRIIDNVIGFVDVIAPFRSRVASVIGCTDDSIVGLWSIGGIAGIALSFVSFPVLGGIFERPVFPEEVLLEADRDPFIDRVVLGPALSKRLRQDRHTSELGFLVRSLRHPFFERVVAEPVATEHDLVSPSDFR